MAMRSILDWSKRHGTLLVGIGTAGAILGIGLAAAGESTPAAALVVAREMYGLTALGFLFASVLIGPLTAVLVRMPPKLRGWLIARRRAVGLSAFVLVSCHVLCYLLPVLARSWRELFKPGVLWCIGLGLGLLAASDLAALAWTSRDGSVRALGAKRWKRLHRTVYLAVPVALSHALIVGADFGFSHPPDVNVEPDAGSLIGFSVVCASWLILVWLRRRGVRWAVRAPASLPPGDAGRPAEPGSSPGGGG
jgi:sulfoxide reductase heme-binding subunit YedZ